jgi:hypothetical protein
MRLPSPDDPELWAVVHRYVMPKLGGTSRYMRLGHGLDRLKDPTRGWFLRKLARGARRVTDRELHLLLDCEWRARITAAWLIGLDRRTQFRGALRDLLLDSEVVFSGQGYCFALARFAAPADADILCAYLDTYLPQVDKRYDQTWALGALLHIDALSGTDHAARFLTDGGLWQQWCRTEPPPGEHQALIERLCAMADEYMTGR